MVKWTPGGRRLISGSSGGDFTLVDFHDSDRVIQAHQSAVRAMTWAKNGEWMVTGDQDGLMKYWNPSIRPMKEVKAHTASMRAMSFSPTDAKLATCSDDLTIKIWDFASVREESVLKVRHATSSLPRRHCHVTSTSLPSLPRHGHSH